MLQSIVPKQSAEVQHTRSMEDRCCYLKGKEDAAKELPRDPTVQYKDSRDIDCYNMGYSSKEGLR